ncbi:response regulator transcription factor [Sulfurospirillum barnesii]|uniref:Response regulator with CheY-like receiver domain and winged-helix DNA-binding domain n=1 Tax=Sulfurospirillum barnesii (strain ATCC 700032 / DSM 10660 / SES-3) TaxID=760154 RepID=I3XWC5_SULBS|nr:response regulator transcription factor [Sulfurospirillum barnesii]AFL68249.1 response regulator with CheY-like receiver domain and winged-helix DNA-binding domain [Sulfurospirillum barnesii SES-3]
MHQPLSLLLIEDDSALRTELEAFLSDFFDEIISCDSAENAYTYYEKKRFDVVVSDIELPAQNGLAFIEKIKKKNPSQMVLVISAYKEVDYFLKSIELGIFSFLTKPFDSQHLINTFFKVTALLRKEHNHDCSHHRLVLSEGVVFDRQEHTLHVKGVLQELTAKEELLLSLLAKHVNQFVRNEHLCHAVWKSEEVNSSTLRALVKRLRDKLGYDESIINLKNRGYKLRMNHL